jgi:hypothetical protein
MKLKATLLSTSLLLTLATAAHAQNICVYDPSGAQGDGYSFMKDYAVAAKQWGADITLKPYTDDEKASHDYKDGKCDGLFTTGIRARVFNNFTGSIDAAGQISTEATARVVVYLMANPKLTNDMTSGDTEVVGVSPLGPAYPMVTDKSINSMARMSGRTFGVLDYDKPQQVIVDKIGAKGVVVNLNTIAGKFNNGQVDIIDVPAMAVKALDLSKGMAKNGAIIRYPVAYLTTQILIHPAKFPQDYGVKSRSWVSSQLDRQFKTVQRIENSIDAKFWLELPASEKLGYDKLLRLARISLSAEGVYNKRMAGIAKKTRCLQSPTNFDCAMTGE